MLNADEENPWTKKEFGLEDKDAEAEDGEEEGDEMMMEKEGGREEDTAGLVGGGSSRA